MFTLIIAPLLENVTPPGAFNRSNTVYRIKLKRNNACVVPIHNSAIGCGWLHK